MTRLNRRASDKQYRLFEHPLPVRPGKRRIIDDTDPYARPVKQGDTVSFRADDIIAFYLEVENLTNDSVQGKLIGIGPASRSSWEGWAVGDSVEV
ncbi:MAG: hypothetical protein AAF420_03675, partial [Pseudomonadota bacterium]